MKDIKEKTTIKRTFDATIGYIIFVMAVFGLINAPVDVNHWVFIIFSATGFFVVIYNLILPKP